MAAFTKYTNAIGPALKADNVATAVWKVALAATINAADTTFIAGTTDLATGGGYTQGGNTAATTSANVIAGVLKLILANPAAWTATGAGFTFRYVILYNSTTSVPYGYWDRGANVVMSGDNADVFTALLDQSNGVFSAS